MIPIRFVSNLSFFFSYSAVDKEVSACSVFCRGLEEFVRDKSPSGRKLFSRFLSSLLFFLFFFRTTRPFYKESLQFFQRSSRGVRTKRSSNFHRDPRNATGRHSSVPFVRDSKQLLDLCTVKYIMRRGMSCPGCVKRISLFARNHRASSPRFS